MNFWPQQESLFARTRCSPFLIFSLCIKHSSLPSECLNALLNHQNSPGSSNAYPKNREKLFSSPPDPVAHNSTKICLTDKGNHRPMMSSRMSTLLGSCWQIAARTQTRCVRNANAPVRNANAPVRISMLSRDF